MSKTFRRLTHEELRRYAPLSETHRYAELDSVGNIWNAPVQHPALDAPRPGRFIDRLSSEERKRFPMATGLIDYAPDALAAISHVSWVGNNKHNPGQPLHHARGKSMDHADCEVRHLSTRSSVDPAYAGDPIETVSHMAEKAWRAIMELQEAMEKIYFLDLAPGAKAAE